MSEQVSGWPGRDERREVADEVRSLQRALRARETLLEERERKLAAANERLQAVLASRSWRLTRPLRASIGLARRAAAFVRGTPDSTRRLMVTMFDEDWYARSYGRRGDGLLDEYLTTGWRQGRDPSPLFDGAWYATEFPERLGETSPLEDFVTHPYSRRPNRWFDPRIWRRLPDHESDVATFLGGLQVVERAPGRNAALRSRPGAVALEDGCAACVYVHHDPDAAFDPHVASTVAALAGAGVLVVVCSTTDVSDEACEPLLADATSVLSVPNTGHDWGAYHAGLGFVLDRCAPRSIVLMNDSVYVIPDRLEAFLERVARSPYDVVGATDSLMFRYHLQSYFVHLGRVALESPLLPEFLSTYVGVSDKHYVVNSYEIGFSQRALEHGLSVRAAYPLEELLTSTSGLTSSYGVALAPNPTLELWEELLERGSPFVKAQLLREMKPDPWRLRQLVPSETLALAADHLARTSGRAVPDWALVSQGRSVHAAAQQRPQHP